MKAGDVMTRRVITIREDATVREAARLMLQDDISGLPVVDRDGKLAGIVSEGDLLRRSETGTEVRRPRWLEFLVGPGVLANEYVQTHGRRISEVMSKDPVTVTEDTELEAVVRLMERRRVKRIIVLHGGEIVGLISRSNLLQALADLSPEQQPTSTSDQAIRARIAAEMAKLHWKPSASINPIVHDGVVNLHGVIADDHEGNALGILCENVPGVVRVEDHLIWVDPFSGLVVDRSGDKPYRGASATQRDQAPA